MDYISVGWFRLQAQRTLQVVRHRIAKRRGAYRKLHNLRPSLPGRLCATTARRVARDPEARKAAQVKVRSKFYAKNVETTKSSNLALEEELATLGGCEPIFPLSEVTLLYGRWRAG